MDRYLFSQVMIFIKKELKDKKISYTDLAADMDMPVSTLKKWFASSDGSLNKLNKVCVSLDLSLQDVLKAIDFQKVKTIRMSKKVQDHFLNDKTAFKVYWLLVYERIAVEKIAGLLKLNQQSLKLQLLALDRLGLIEVGTNEKVRLPKVKPVRWTAEGAFMKRILKDWASELLITSIESEDSGRFILQFFQLSEESEREFQNDLLKLEEKYARRTIYEMNAPGIVLKKIRFLNAIGDGSFL